MRTGLKTALYSALMVPEQLIDAGSKLTRPIRHHIAQARIFAVDDVVKACGECKAENIVTVYTWASQEEDFCETHRDTARKAYLKNKYSRKNP